MSMPKVSVVILNWNAKKFISDCLDSALKMEYGNYDIIYVDNASADGSNDIVSKNYKKHIASGKLKTIFNSKNFGFAEGNNIGIRLALKNTPDYIALLNPDIIVDKKWLSGLVEISEKNKKIGAVQGKMLAFDKKTIDSTGIVFNSPVINAVDRGQGKRDAGQYEKEEELLAVCAAGALYRVSALNDIKMGTDYFDSDFFCYWEDSDICARMFLFGWKIFYCPKSIMYHGRSVLTGKRSKFSTYYLHRNNLWFMVKCVPTPIIIKKIPLVILFNILSFGSFLILDRKVLASFLKAKIDSAAGMMKMMKKRNEIMKKSVVNYHEFDKFLSRKLISS